MINSWYEKFDKLSKNYKEEVKNIISNNNEPTKISNHLIYNYTGRYIFLFRYKQSSKRKGSKDYLDEKNFIDAIPNGNLLNKSLFITNRINFFSI